MLGAGVGAGAVAFGAIGAAGYFWNKRNARTQMLDMAAQGEQNLTTARTNPLYETPDNVFDNPLYEDKSANVGA
jgi:homoserine kinase